MPEQVIQAIMERRNPRTGRNYTRDEAEAIIAARQHSHGKGVANVGKDFKDVHYHGPLDKSKGHTHG